MKVWSFFCRSLVKVEFCMGMGKQVSNFIIVYVYVIVCISAISTFVDLCVLEVSLLLLTCLFGDSSYKQCHWIFSGAISLLKGFLLLEKSTLFAWFHAHNDVMWWMYLHSTWSTHLLPDHSISTSGFQWQMHYASLQDDYYHVINASTQFTHVHN